ncbi:MAG: radical SAM family heme chaperone HemW [Fimbriimonadaceae bacterium]|nr:radical SAM family heme chaperone HemW [Fimbriimonadaceae bacterium]QYK57883.1 MAG: radical SAM family heme chaperone HemW [Fimbriimonadaceae bacterium]
MEPVAVYVHTPFCPSKCGYCDFNSYAMSGGIVDRTVQAMLAEIHRSPWRGRPAKTVFFGGGTPTFLSPGQLTGLLKAVLEVHPPIPGAEVTSEANPGTVDAEKFDAMVEAGFNRLSLGAQSFDTGDLHRLGRIHEATDVAKAVAAARRAGFRSLNIDLMFALPGQSMRGWRTNLELALGLAPDHLSLYCLTIEPNTRFYRHHLRGALELPSEETQVAMYDLAVQRCQEAGLDHYEISNFARPGHESRHNLCYWRAEEYLAYGPGAVGCFGSGDDQRTRYTNTKHPERYAEAVESGLRLWCDEEAVDGHTRRTEAVMLGLRLSEGLDVQSMNLDPDPMVKAVERGWAAVSEGRFRLTDQGRHWCSEVATWLI